MAYTERHCKLQVPNTWLFFSSFLILAFGCVIVLLKSNFTICQILVSKLVRHFESCKGE